MKTYSGNLVWKPKRQAAIRKTEKEDYNTVSGRIVKNGVLGEKRKELREQGEKKNVMLNLRVFFMYMYTHNAYAVIISCSSIGVI